MEELWKTADDEEPRFQVAWRGYDRHQVDEFVRAAKAAGEDAELTPEFDVVLRGYDRKEVERYFERFLR